LNPGVLEAAIPEISNVSGTAFVVAEFRAEENDEPFPLYRDSIVRLFLNENSKQAAGRVATSLPAVKDVVKIRTKYFDDVLAEEIKSGVRQVLILGAGLDTRAVRKQAAGVTYFEIDDGATMRFKLMLYGERRIRVNAKLISGNYVTDGVIDLLQENNFNFDLPTYVIWEGNTMYLPLDSSRQILRELRKHLRQLRVSFDYMDSAVVSNTTGDPGITKLVETFAKMGAPWISGIRNVEAFADETNLKLIDNFKTAELHEKYWLGRLSPSSLFKFYSVCTLGSQSLACPSAR
jgi:methyltransferase (TIGR00027 family)